MDKKSEVILFIFKNRRWPQEFIINKFSHYYKTEKIFISDIIEKNNREIIKFINQTIKKNNISAVIFEGDHISIFNFNFIKSIKGTKKGILLFDDFMYHDINLLTAQACDFVLTGCPHSSIKFKKMGHNSLFIPIESDGNIFKKYDNIEKKIDVLFFGDQNKYRKDYIDYIRKNGINLKTVSIEDKENPKHEDLVKLINESKIVINFSRAEFLKKKYLNSHVYKNYYQFKGRLYQTGLCGTACVTEHSPSHSLIFNENELISFKSKEECINILKKTLSDKKILEFYANNLYKKCIELEDKNYIKKIKKLIDADKVNLNITNKFPFWYKFIFIKQRIWLRFRKEKFLPFFKEIFDIIFSNQKNLFIETLLFSLYSVSYSFAFLIKYPFKKIKKTLIR